MRDATARTSHFAAPKSAKALATAGCEGFRLGLFESDIDDHHTAFSLFAGWGHRRAGTGIPFTLDRELGSTAFFLAAPFLFFFEDLFDNPGIQHGGPPFRGTRGRA